MENETRHLYSKQLALNLQLALPNDKVEYYSGRIYLHLLEVVADEKDRKQWLYRVLEKLPEIVHPIERIQFVIYQADSMDLITIINPSKFDVMAVHDAIESGLSFSSPPAAAWELEPLPLDHPYYTEKDWLNKLMAKTKNKTRDIDFKEVKDLPNVKPILEKIRKQGIKI